MPLIARILIAAVLLSVVGFCIVGFAASFEPPDDIVWRVVYGVIGFVCLGLAGIALLARRRMDFAPRDLEAIEYYRRADHYLAKRAKWIKKFKTKRTGMLSIDQPGFLTKEHFAKAAALLAKRGIHWKYDPRRLRVRRFAEFIIDAPGQPRSLQVHHGFRKESIRSLRIIIEIDGFAARCTLHYAGFARRSGDRWSEAQQKMFFHAKSYPREPEEDVEYILNLLEGIMSERLILLRYVRWDEIGHGSGLFPVTQDIVVESCEPILPPANYASLDWAAEAIVYTWTGKDDRQLIAPRYEEMRARSGGV